jgi:DNA-binding response OmpR family regulator
LVKLIWGTGKNFPTRTIDVHISSIRKKLAYIKGARIDSIYGNGYKFILLTRF